MRRDSPGRPVRRPAVTDWPLVVGLLRSVARGEFGADLLAGPSIVGSVLLDQYLAGTLVVLMLSGGQAIEAFAVGRTSAVLATLARRVPCGPGRTRD